MMKNLAEGSKKFPLLRMPQDLPQVRFPIGQEEGQGTICMLVDTGAGLNTGHLSYHLDIARKYPHLVKQLTYIKDIKGAKPIPLGSVNSNKWQGNAS